MWFIKVISRKNLTACVLLWLIAMLCGSHSLHAQPYYFKHYQVENGLSHNTVHCSIQDKDGFMWFGTKDGLNRFDGYRFKKIGINPENDYALNPDLIYDLYQDRNGRLWVGTQYGLYQYDALRERLVPHFVASERISNITMSHDGLLWFTSGIRLCRYSLAERRVKIFAAAQTGIVSAIGALPGGDVWIGTTDGFLKRLDSNGRIRKSTDVFGHSAPISSHHIQVIHSAGPNTLFIGTSSQGIKLYDVASGIYKDLLTRNPDKTSIYVRDILTVTDKEFWFATESGIFILDLPSLRFTNLQKRFLDPYTLLDNAVYTLCKDKENGIWAGTYFGGINHFPAQDFAFAKYFPNYTQNNISGSVVREICPDEKGNLWIGTEDAGLNKLNVQTGSIVHYKPTGAPGSIAYTNIHGLLAVNNELWIGTFEHGLDVMDITTGRVIRHYAAGPGPLHLKGNFILTLCRTKGGSIYVGTSEGLYRYVPEQDGFKRIAAIPDNVFVAALFEDRSQTLWISTHGNGLYFINTLTGASGNYRSAGRNENSLPGNTINAVFEDSGNALWIATEGGGLTKLSQDRRRFTRYTTRTGLPSNFVFKVLADRSGKIWATTSKGLFSLNPATGSISLYTKESGLLNDQFNYGSGYIDSSGKLYFGSTKGMIAFDPLRFINRKVLPPLYVTGFQVHNRELEPGTDSSYLKQSIIHTAKIALPHDQSSFSINYSALSFAAPEMTTYSYKMEGLDESWTELKKNRSIYFTNLAPGNYSLHIKAAINGSGSAAHRQLAIEILPPWWATKLAYALYALLAVAAIYLLLHTYHGYMENVKEKEIYAAKIDFFTNVAHEIRTPLTLIKGPVENLMEQVADVPQIKEDVDMMERNTARLMALITQILDFRQTETKSFSLYFGKVNVSDLVREEFYNFAGLAKKRQLQYNLHMPEKPIVAIADEDALRKILSNLFSNAVKYAGKQIWVELKPAPDETELVLEVRNDGPAIPKEMSQRIFEPFFRLKDATRQKGTGIGLALARSLTQLHSGSLYLQEEKQGVNSFVLRLPLKPASTVEKKKNRFALTRFL